ncbi:MAG: YXWGXW repeat-containing protein [Burkholderiales bacterium]
MSLETLLHALIAIMSLSGPPAGNPPNSPTIHEETVEAPVPPPLPRYEAMPPPRSGFVWAPGHWRWNGCKHAWTAGHWEKKHPGAQWVPDRWLRAGRTWRFEPGHWTNPFPVGRSPIAARPG